MTNSKAGERIGRANRRQREEIGGEILEEKKEEQKENDIRGSTSQLHSQTQRKK